MTFPLKAVLLTPLSMRENAAQQLKVTCVQSLSHYNVQTVRIGLLKEWLKLLFHVIVHQ